MKKQDETFDYASHITELEKVVAQLQDSDVSLDEAIKLHEKGKALTAELQAYLDKAELVVRKHMAEGQ